MEGTVYSVPASLHIVHKNDKRLEWYNDDKIGWMFAFDIDMKDIKITILIKKKKGRTEK